MANLTDAAEFTANEIYEMQQTDGCEAAAPGASFGGLGVNNQPHQQLANRTAFLKNRQDVNIGNIATLLAFMAEFASDLGPTGYLKLGATDINLGAVVPIFQWSTGEFVNIQAGGQQSQNIALPIGFTAAPRTWLITPTGNAGGAIAAVFFSANPDPAAPNTRFQIFARNVASGSPVSAAWILWALGN